MLQSLMMHITSTILIGPNYKVLVLMWTYVVVFVFSLWCMYQYVVLLGAFPAKQCDAASQFTCQWLQYFSSFLYVAEKITSGTFNLAEQRKSDLLQCLVLKYWTVKVHTHNQCGRNMQVCGFLAFDVMVSEVCKDCSRFSTVYARASRSRCLMGIHFSRC